MRYERELAPEWRCDEYGAKPDDYRWMRWDYDRHQFSEALKALKALWSKGGPDAAGDRTSGRGDDWTLGRAVLATIAILTGRRWNDAARARWRDRRPLSVFGCDMAYWDAHHDGCESSYAALRLYPGLRIALENDGG